MGVVCGKTKDGGCEGRGKKTAACGHCCHGVDEEVVEASDYGMLHLCNIIIQFGIRNGKAVVVMACCMMKREGEKRRSQDEKC